MPDSHLPGLSEKDNNMLHEGEPISECSASQGCSKQAIQGTIFGSKQVSKWSSGFHAAVMPFTPLSS